MSALACSRRNRRAKGCYRLDSLLPRFAPVSFAKSLSDRHSSSQRLAQMQQPLDFTYGPGAGNFRFEPLQPGADLERLLIAQFRYSAPCIGFCKRFGPALAQRIHQRLDGHGGGSRHQNGIESSMSRVMEPPPLLASSFGLTLRLRNFCPFFETLIQALSQNSRPPILIEPL